MLISMGLYVFIATKSVEETTKGKLRNLKNNHPFSKPGCNLRDRLIWTVVNTIRMTDTFA